MALQVWFPLKKDLRNNGLSSNAKFSNVADLTIGKVSPLNGGSLSLKDNHLAKIEELSLTSKKTICFWGLSMVDMKNLEIIFLHSSSTDEKLILLVNGSKFIFHHSNGNLYTICDNIVQDKEWHHYAIVFSDDYTFLLIDGVEVGHTIPFPNIIDECEIYLAGAEGSATPHWTCLISDFRIYDNVLTEKDIMRLYNRKVYDLVSQGSTIFERSGRCKSSNTVNALENSLYFSIDKAISNIEFEGTEFSMNFWIYRNDTGHTSMPPSGETLFWYSYRSGQTTTITDLTIKPIKSNFNLGTAASGAFRTNKDILFSANSWNMITMTQNSATSHFYLNGVLKEEGINKSTNNAFCVGRTKNIGINAKFFNGYMKQIQIFNSELSIKDVQELYNIGPQVDTDFNTNYTKLKYIEATGTQYIDTGIKWSSGSSIEIEFLSVSTGGNYAIFGASNGNAYSSGETAFFWNAGKYDTVIPTSNNSGKYYKFGTYEANTKYKLEYNSASTIVTKLSDNTTYSQTNTNFFANYVGNRTLALFASNRTNGYIAKASFKLIKMKFMRNSNLEMYLIPAKRKSDDVIGMYDMVTKTFFTNEGTGTFTAGPEI